MSWISELGEAGYVIVRFGSEIGVKSSRVRARYERWVLEALSRRLRRRGLRVEGLRYVFGRAYLMVSDVDAVLKEASRTFGVSSASPAVKTSAELSELVGKAVKVASAVLREGEGFAVKCRRVGSHPYKSPDVVKAVGSAILRELRGRGVRVDLDDPDVVVGVEVRDQDAYIYVGDVKGPGGLPAGSQGRVVCLVSGGIDSPVAAWMAMRRGCAPILLHFDLGGFKGPSVVDKVAEVAGILADWTPHGRLRLCVVRHEEALRRVRERAPEGLTCLLCKRIMLRVACRLAELKGAMGVVTGDIIGEQASQTLNNLYVVNAVASGTPIYRPLAGMDKAEVEQLARWIGTYDASAKPEAGCQAAPKRPRTRASLSEVERAEAEVGVEDLVGQELESLEERVVEA